MANQHSLPFQSQRIATQLPFSPSQSGNNPTSPTRRTFALTSPTSPSNGAPSGIPAHVRSGSSGTSKTRISNVTSAGELPYSLPPLPVHQPRASASSNAVPGILPSASFFYPSRPSYPIPPLPPLPRSTSPTSVVSSDAHVPSPLKLTALSRPYAVDSDASDSNGASTEDLNHQPESIPLPSTSKSTTQKHSREPLIPHSSPRPPRKSTGASRPSINVNLGPYGRNDGGVSPGARVRDSFEKLFKRRLSSDIQSKRAGPSHIRTPTGNDSMSQIPRVSTLDSPMLTNARMTFDVSTEDGHHPMSAHFKGTSSPGHPSSISLQNFSFNPTPPDVHPPLAQTPILDEKSRKAIRRYQVYPSRNHFFIGGRILTGGDHPTAFIASLFVVFSISGVWFSTTCVWWWLHESPSVAAVGVYMCLLTISSMLATALRDPGILPRNLDLEPPFPPSNGSQDSIRVPLPRDLKVRAGIVRVKYCPTCRIYRPPRSSHCKMCDNCVDNCDHHCQWVNNCIGRRNYTTFFTFLFSAVLTLVLVICTTAIHLWLLTTHRFNLSFHEALKTPQGVGSAVAFSMSILVIWPVSALLAYHLRLLLLNVTTIEQIRNQAHKTLVPGPAPPNPFSHGNWRRNFLYVLCRPAGYSWLDGRVYATEDKREINPGLLDDAWQGAIEEGRVGEKGQ